MYANEAIVQEIFLNKLYLFISIYRIAVTIE